MTGALHPYPAYRDSGVLWLGQIPAHWEVRRNGRLFAERREAGDPELPLLEVSLRTGVRVRTLGEGARKQVMADPSKYQRARAGDVAYNTMRMWQGAVGVAPVDGLISPAYVVAQPRPGVEPRYYAYLFRTAAYLQQVEIESRGIVPDRNRLYWDAFKAMPSVYPPNKEQRAMADYLDAKERVAHHYTRVRHRILELLAQQQQQVVAAVLKCAPTFEPRTQCPVTMADYRVKALARNVVDIAEPGARSDRYLGLDGIESWSGRMIGAEAGAPFDSAGRRFNTGDVLFGKLRPYLAKVVRADGPGACVGEILVLRTEVKRVLPEYLEQVLRSAPFIHLISGSVYGAKMPRVEWDTIGRVRICIPKRVEDQRAALDRIAEATAQLRAAADRIHSELALVREYKERLIVDVVMGRFDVRELSVPTAGELISAEADESEAFDSDADLTDEADDALQLDAVTSDAD